MITSMYKACENVIAVTNRTLVEGDYLTQLEKVCSRHPRALILREKDLSAADYRELAKAVLEICRRAGVACFLHSHIAIARELGCPHLHLSLAGLLQAGDLSRDFEEISVSCHSREDVEKALSLGANRIVLGTIFPTDCKPGLTGRGTDFVREICDMCPLPVYAIGGITFENLPRILEAGAAGGCMMSAMMKLN